MKYKPGQVSGDINSLPLTVKGEFERIGAALNQLSASYIILEEQNVEPTKVYDGMLIRADGTNWNPGLGPGLYYYLSGWIFIA